MPDGDGVSLLSIFCCCSQSRAQNLILMMWIALFFSCCARATSCLRNQLSEDRLARLLSGL